MKCEYQIVVNCPALEAEMWWERKATIPFCPPKGFDVDITYGGVNSSTTVDFTTWYADEGYLGINLDCKITKNVSVERYNEFIRDFMDDPDWHLNRDNTDYGTLAKIKAIKKQGRKAE